MASMEGLVGTEVVPVTLELLWKFGQAGRTTGGPGIFGRDWGEKCREYPHFSAGRAAFGKKEEVP